MNGLRVLILSKEFSYYRGRLVQSGLVGESSISATKDPLEIDSMHSLKFDIVFGEPNLIKDVLPKIEGLRWVHSSWAGVEPLLHNSLRRDYTLTNSRGIFGPLMSEFVFGYMLLHERKILQKMAAQKEKRWDGGWTGTLRGKTLGIMGVGSIGSHIATTAKHFQMNVRGYTRCNENCPFVDKYFHGDSLRDFAKDLDYVVCTLPNTSLTSKLIDEAFLSSLPKNAVFINVGRGNSVDDAALISALKGGHLAAAVLDVFSTEPLPADHDYWTTPNLFITAHTSAPSYPNTVYEVFEENLRRFTSGEELKHCVDFEKGY